MDTSRGALQKEEQGTSQGRRGRELITNRDFTTLECCMLANYLQNSTQSHLGKKHAASLELDDAEMGQQKKNDHISNGKHGRVSVFEVQSLKMIICIVPMHPESINQHRLFKYNRTWFMRSLSFIRAFTSNLPSVISLALIRNSHCPMVFNCEFAIWVSDCGRSCCAEI